MLRQIGVTMAAMALTAGLTGCTGLGKPLPALRMDGERALDRGDNESAIAAYYKVLQRKPEDPEANYGIGRAYLGAGRAREARTHLQMVYGVWWARVGVGDEVAGYLAEAIAQSGTHDQLFAFLAERANSTGTTADYIRWGDYSAQLGDPDSAELAFRTAARIDAGTSADPYLRLASLYETLGRTDEAVVCLRQAYGIDADNREVVQRLESYVSVVGPTLALPYDQ